MADGVGGWRNYGIDPSEFSSRLMKLCQKIVLKGNICYEPPRPTGSSTACVLIVQISYEYHL